jgi:hypothetical protein
MGAKTWNANAAYTWVRSDRQHFADHPIHKAKGIHRNERFTSKSMSRKAKKRFSRLLNNALLKRPSPDPEPTRPERHPITHQPARRAPTSTK